MTEKFRGIACKLGVECADINCQHFTQPILLPAKTKRNLIIVSAASRLEAAPTVEDDRNDDQGHKAIRECLGFVSAIQPLGVGVGIGIGIEFFFTPQRQFANGTGWGALPMCRGGSRTAPTESPWCWVLGSAGKTSWFFRSGGHQIIFRYRS